MNSLVCVKTSSSASRGKLAHTHILRLLLSAKRCSKPIQQTLLFPIHGFLIQMATFFRQKIGIGPAECILIRLVKHLWKSFVVRRYAIHMNHHVLLNGVALGKKWVVSLRQAAQHQCLMCLPEHGCNHKRITTFLLRRRRLGPGSKYRAGQ